MRSAAAVVADGFGDETQSAGDGVGGEPPAFFVGADEFGVALVGAAFPFVEVPGHVFVYFAPPFVEEPVVHKRRVTDPG